MRVFTRKRGLLTGDRGSTDGGPVLWFGLLVLAMFLGIVFSRQIGELFSHMAHLFHRNR